LLTREAKVQEMESLLEMYKDLEKVHNKFERDLQNLCDKLVEIYLRFNLAEEKSFSGDKIQHLQQACRVLETTLEKLKEANNKETNTNKKVNTLVKEYESRYSTSKKKISELEALMLHSNEKLKAIQVQLNEKDLMIQTMKEESAQSRDISKGRETEIEQLSTMNQEFERDFSKLRTEKDSLATMFESQLSLVKKDSETEETLTKRIQNQVKESIKQIEDDYHSKTDYLKKLVNQANIEKETLENEKTQLQNQLNIKDQNIEKFSQVINTFEKSIEELNNGNQKLKEEKRNLQEEINNVKNNWIPSLEDSKRNLIEEINLLKIVHKGCKEQIELKETLIKKLELDNKIKYKQLEEMELSVRSLSEEIKNLKSLNKNFQFFENQANTLQEQMKIKDIKIQNLKNDNSKLKGANEKLKQVEFQIEEFRKELQEKDFILKKVSENHKSLELENSKLKEFENQVQILKKSLKDNETQILNLTTQEKLLNNTNTQLEKEHQQKEVALLKISRESESLKVLNHQLAKELSQLKTYIEELEKGKVSVEGHRKKRVDDLLLQKEEYQVQLNTFELKFNDKQFEISKLKENYEEIISNLQNHLNIKVKEIEKIKHESHYVFESKKSIEDLLINTQQELNELQKLNKGLNEEIKILNKNSEVHTRELFLKIDQLHGEIEEKNIEIRQTSQEIEILKEGLFKIKKEASDIRQAHQKKDIELETLKLELKRQENEHQNIMRDLRNKVEESNKLKNEEREKLEAELQSERNDTIQLKNIIDEQQNNVSLKAAYITNLNAKITELQGEIEFIKTQEQSNKQEKIFKESSNIIDKGNANKSFRNNILVDVNSVQSIDLQLQDKVYHLQEEKEKLQQEVKALQSEVLEFKKDKEKSLSQLLLDEERQKKKVDEFFSNVKGRGRNSSVGSKLPDQFMRGFGSVNSIDLERMPEGNQAKLEESQQLQNKIGFDKSSKTLHLELSKIKSDFSAMRKDKESIESSPLLSLVSNIKLHENDNKSSLGGLSGMNSPARVDKLKLDNQRLREERSSLKDENNELRKNISTFQVQVADLTELLKNKNKDKKDDPEIIDGLKESLLTLSQMESLKGRMNINISTKKEVSDTLAIVKLALEENEEDIVALVKELEEYDKKKGEYEKLKTQFEIIKDRLIGAEVEAKARVQEVNELLNEEKIRYQQEIEEIESKYYQRFLKINSFIETLIKEGTIAELQNPVENSITSDRLMNLEKTIFVNLATLREFTEMAAEIQDNYEK